MSDSSRNDGVRFQSGLWEIEVLKFQKCTRTHQLAQVKYPVTLLMTDLFKFDRK